MQSDPARNPQAAQTQSYSKINGLVALAMALGQLAQQIYKFDQARGMALSLRWRFNQQLALRGRTTL